VYKTERRQSCPRHTDQKLVPEKWYRFLVLLSCNLVPVFFWYLNLVPDRTCSVLCYNLVITWYRLLTKKTGTGFWSVCHGHKDGKQESLEAVPEHRYCQNCSVMTSECVLVALYTNLHLLVAFFSSVQKSSNSQLDYISFLSDRLMVSLSMP